MQATPLFIAAQLGFVEVVKALLQGKASVDKPKDDCGTTPLFIAAQNGELDVVKALIAAGANKDLTVTPANGQQYTPHDTASVFGHVQVADFLIPPKQEADEPLFEDSDGDTTM